MTILAAADGKAKQIKFTDKLRAAASRWAKNDLPPLYGGVGGFYKGLENVAKSSGEAGRSLAFLQSRRRMDITQYADIGVNRLFMNQKPEEIEDYIEEVLSPLRMLKANSGDLAKKLLAYMAANRSTSVTAEALHIHPNTLYHRLRKIEETLGIDLNDPDDWLKV